MKTSSWRLLALASVGCLFSAPAAASHQRGPYSVDIIVHGQPQQVHMSGGRAYVAGVYGAAYQLQVHNRSGRRVEAVVAVDGRDVITGQPIHPHRHRGYLVPAHGTASIAGFRTTSSSVATFRFSTIPRSYAWRTGTAWGIGTIRVWIFEEAASDPVMVLPDDPPYSRGGPRRGSPNSSEGRTPSGPRGRKAPGAPGAAEGMAPSAPRDMGTEYGEQRWSPSTRTRFVRRSGRAGAVLGVRYQSRDALLAAGILRPPWQPEPHYPQPPYYHYDRWPSYAPPPPGYPYY